MGRLFWKFFLLAALAQFATILAVAAWLWVRHDLLPSPGFRPDPVAEHRLEEASNALTRDGVDAYRARLDAWSREPGPRVLTVDGQGRELLGRRVDRLPPAGREPAAEAASLVRRVSSGGAEYVVFVEPAPQPRERPSRLPLEPVVGGLIATLVIAGLLAGYVSAPVRNLRSAFGAVAEGRLDVRIGKAMGRRRDDLADLGRDFDHTVERLQALVDGQRRLLHTVSHELRSPLARLQAAIGLARQSANLEQAMDRIELEAERMDRLVDELLTLSRLESRVTTDPAEAVELAELIDDVVGDAIYEVEAAGRPVAIEREVSTPAGTAVAGSPEMLHRALDNVLRNAIRHAGEPGRVRVRAHLDPKAARAIVSITDSGTGVPAAELESIFEPFFRGESARGRQGHGLGLAITRRIVDAHGGSVSASNAPDGGLAVEVRLPVASALPTSSTAQDGRGADA